MGLGNKINIWSEKGTPLTLKGINIIRHNLCVGRSHTLIGEVKCIYTCLNGPRIEPVLVLIVRYLGTLAYDRAKYRNYISVRYLCRNYATKVGAER